MYGNFTSPWDLVLTITTIFGLVAVSFLFQRWFRLRHIPGPVLASLTDVWLASRYRNGEHYVDLITRLHAQYGPVVRWGPSRVSFALPEAIPAIYGVKNALEKAESYGPLTAVSNGKPVVSLVALRDERRTASIKRHVAAGFSRAGFLRQEKHMDDVLDQLLDFVKASENEDSVHLSKLLRFWSFDTINRIAFSDDLGYMAAGAETSNVFAGVTQRFEHWKRWYALPGFEWLLYQSPLFARKSGSPSILTKVAMQRLAERKKVEGQNVDSDLLGEFLAASRKDPETISNVDVIALTLSTISAGSDTIATTVSMALVNLMRNPQAFERLEDEILSANLAVPPSFKDVASLPYLNATIMESMRVATTSGTSIERKVPDEGAVVCGVPLPAGTSISACVFMIHRASEIYGPDSELFRPERWTDCDKATWSNMDKYHMGFSKGRRACTGRDLAEIEMKKVLASLITLWKISLAEDPWVGWNANFRSVDLKVKLQRR